MGDTATLYYHITETINTYFKSNIFKLNNNKKNIRIQILIVHFFTSELFVFVMYKCSLYLIISGFSSVMAKWINGTVSEDSVCTFYAV